MNIKMLMISGLMVVSFGFAGAALALDDNGCLEWRSHGEVQTDGKYLAKLLKKIEKQKQGEGYDAAKYSTERLVHLIMTDLNTAKTLLESGRKQLEKDKYGQIDLSGTSFLGADLSNLNLSDVNFKGAKLDGANLSYADLKGANLEKVSLNGADLRSADLTGANIKKTSIINTNLAYAKMNGAQLIAVDLTGSNMCKTNLSSTMFKKSIMTGAYVKHATVDMAINPPMAFYEFPEAVFEYGLRIPNQED